MESMSGISTPLVVDISKRARLVFKRHPFKSIQDAPEGEFSSVSYDVLHNEDIRAYIHCDVEELGNANMLTLYNKHLANLRNLKSKHKILHDKGLVKFIYFLIFDEAKWVRYILTRVHDEFIWLDRQHKITKKAIQAVTCLSGTSEVPKLRKVQNKTMIAATDSKFNNKANTISDMLEHDITFASMVVGYKVYQSNRQNSVSGTAILLAYQILKEDKRYDLCIVLLNESINNLKKIKHGKKHIFKFGSLLICLALYFLNKILGIKGKFQ